MQLIHNMKQSNITRNKVVQGDISIKEDKKQNSGNA